MIKDCRLDRAMGAAAVLMTTAVMLSGCRGGTGEKPQPTDAAHSYHPSSYRDAYIPEPINLSGVDVEIRKTDAVASAALSDGLMKESSANAATTTSSSGVTTIEVGGKQEVITLPPGARSPQPEVTRPAPQPVTRQQAPASSPPPTELIVKPAPVAAPASTAPARPSAEERREAVRVARFTRQFAEQVENAHGLSRWRRQPALQMDLHVQFGDRPPMVGRFVFDTSMKRVRADLEDGTTLFYDGAKAWVSPAAADFQRAGFHLLTWPYFMAAPFKLRDPGTQLTPQQPAALFGTPCSVARLTFEPGIGVSPDNWYVLYADPGTHWLRAMAYVVTYGRSIEVAEQKPHVIIYDDYHSIEGVILPRRWTFMNWNTDQGPYGDPIGSAQITNVRFVRTAPAFFDVPGDAREDQLPGKP